MKAPKPQASTTITSVKTITLMGHAKKSAMRVFMKPLDPLILYFKTILSQKPKTRIVALPSMEFSDGKSLKALAC